MRKDRQEDETRIEPVERTADAARDEWQAVLCFVAYARMRVE